MLMETKRSQMERKYYTFIWKIWSLKCLRFCKERFSGDVMVSCLLLWQSSWQWVIYSNNFVLFLELNYCVRNVGNVVYIPFNSVHPITWLRIQRCVSWACSAYWVMHNHSVCGSGNKSFQSCASDVTRGICTCKLKMQKTVVVMAI